MKKTIQKILSKITQNNQEFPPIEYGPEEDDRPQLPTTYYDHKLRTTINPNEIDETHTTTTHISSTAKGTGGGRGKGTEKGMRKGKRLGKGKGKGMGKGKGQGNGTGQGKCQGGGKGMGKN